MRLPALTALLLVAASACHGDLALRALPCDGSCDDAGSDPFACARRAVLRIDSSAGTRVATFDPAVGPPALTIPAARPTTLTLLLFAPWSLPADDGSGGVPIAAGAITADALDGRASASLAIPLRCRGGCPGRASLRVRLRDFDSGAPVALPTDAALGALGPRTPPAATACATLSDAVTTEPDFTALAATRDVDGWRGPLPSAMSAGCLAVRLPSPDGGPDDLCLGYPDEEALTAFSPTALRRRALRTLLAAAGPSRRGALVLGARTATGAVDGGAQIVARDSSGATRPPTAWLALDGTLQPTAPSPHAGLAVFTDAALADYVVDFSSGERRTFSLAAAADSAAITWFVAAP